MILIQEDPLFIQLRSVAEQADPVPEFVYEAARAAFLLRRLDAELAELVMDSNVDSGAVLVRGSATEDQVRMLSFETESVSIDIQVTTTDGSRTLLVLVHGASGEVGIETSLGRTRETIDEHGRFTVSQVPAGTVRLHLTADNGSAVTTSWVSL